MKRLIAISVVFALVAGAAFAGDVNVGGDVFGRIDFLQGDTGDGSKVTSTGEWTRLRLEVSGQDDDGVFGAYLRIDRNPWWASETDGQATIATGNVWWKPIDQFKFLIGGNGKDGFFGADGITRWGFYQVAADGVGVFKENWKFSSSFYGGFDSNGAVLTLLPTDALEINIGIPFFEEIKGTKVDSVNNETGNVFKKTNAQFAYTLDGTGKLAITYKGDYMEGNDQPTVYGYFNLNSIENLGVDIGIGFKFPGKEPNISNPISAGLGVSYGAGDLGLKVRVQGTFGGEKTDPMIIIADLLPSYAVNEKITALLDVGLEMTMPDGGDTVTGWHAEPAITIKSNWWAPNFYAGIRIESDGVKGGDGKTLTKWSVPIAIAYSF